VSGLWRWLIGGAGAAAEGGAAGAGGRRAGAAGGAGPGDAWPAGCGATERRAGGRPSGGGREKREREKKQRTEKKGLDVFKYLIFCSQGVAAENKQIFSTAVSEATENTLIFGGCVSGRRK
jgi:hypothetical protein